MEQIIKELYEFINERHLPDCEILLEDIKILSDKLENDNYESYVEYSKQYHRFVDLMDFMEAYNNFKDRLEKVKNNIYYDNH